MHGSKIISLHTSCNVFLHLYVLFRFEDPMLLQSPRPELHLDDELGEDEEDETNLGTWWLAKSLKGSKLLMIYT